MKDNILLIGFMGVGKGSTARALAVKTGMFAVDSDDIIESFTNKKIKKIFSEEGEAVFRQLERHTALWLEKNVQSTIISTGGGFFKVPNVKKVGRVVYLHGEFDRIIEKIFNHHNAKKKIKKRPLLQNIDDAKKLYEERLSAYREAADIEVCVDNKSAEQVCEEILSSLKIHSQE